jgi:hypothetical protein
VPQNAAPAVSVSTSNSANLLSDTDNQPITQFINNIILEAIRRDASDIHLEPVENGAVRIRYRLDGKLYDYQTSQPNQVLQIVSRIKVMSSMDITERRLPQDGMTQVHVGNRIVDIRVSTIPVASGERVVLRLLNRDRSLLPLNHLGMPENALEGFSNALNQPNGIIVVSGPTGSGKTTTLYSALGTMDSVRRNILTIEDITKEVTYTYDCGLGFSDTFALVPQIEETPAETTTTTAAPETTTVTTTTTAPVTTTPATTTPEDDLPQTGFSKLYNCIPVSAGALVLLGMYAVKKSKKEDEE